MDSASKDKCAQNKSKLHANVRAAEPWEAEPFQKAWKNHATQTR